MNKLVLVFAMFSVFRGFGQFSQIIPSVNFKTTPSKVSKYKIKKVEYYSDSNLVKKLNFTPDGLLKDSIIGYNIKEEDLEFSITDMSYSSNKKLETYKYTIYLQNNFRCNQFLRRHAKKRNVIKILKHEKKLELFVQIFDKNNTIMQIYELNNKAIDTITIPEKISYAEYILKPILKVNQYGEINTDIDSLVRTLEDIKVTIDTTIKFGNEIYTYCFYRNDVSNIEKEVYKVIKNEKKFILQHTIDNLELLYTYSGQKRLTNIIQYCQNSIGVNEIISQHQFLYSPNGKLNMIIYDRTSGQFPNKIQLNKDGKLFSITNSSQDSKGGIDAFYSEYGYYANELPKQMISFKNGKKEKKYLLVYQFYN